MEKIQQTQQPVKCINNCGFFGNPNMENMCSKCFKETKSLKRKAHELDEDTVAQCTKIARLDNILPSSTTEAVNPSSSLSNTPETKTTTEPSQKVEESNPLPPKTLFPTQRCTQCNVKISLVSLSCRCNLNFCAKHRAPEEHNCTYDWKAATRKELELKNPKVVASKVANI